MRTHRTRGAVLCASAVNVIDPVAVGLVMCSTAQDLALRTDIDLAEGIEAKVGNAELRFSFRGSCSRVDAMLESRLFEEAGISLAKLQVRDVSIQLFPLAEIQIGKAVIVAVRCELFALKVAWLLTN